MPLDTRGTNVPLVLSGYTQDTREHQKPTAPGLKGGSSYLRCVEGLELVTPGVRHPTPTAAAESINLPDHVSSSV